MLYIDDLVLKRVKLTQSSDQALNIHRQDFFEGNLVQSGVVYVFLKALTNYITNNCL